MKRRYPIVLASLLGTAAALSAFAQGANQAQTSKQATPAFVPVTDQVLANPDPGDWLMVSRTFNEQRFSPLNQINKTNVGQLRMAWSRGLPAGIAGIDADRLSRRDVSLRARRHHPGGRRHQRRSDLGIRAQISRRRARQRRAREEHRHLSRT